MATNWKFTKADYPKIIHRFIEAGYSIIKIGELEELSQLKTPYLAVRHDVDISLHAAFELANIEHQLSLRSTYFISMSSPFYNPFCKDSIEKITSIHNLGHEIALHADFDEQDMRRSSYQTDIDLLKEFFPFTNPRIVSVHHPGSWERLEQLTKFRCVYITYAQAFNGNMEYFSDSNCSWRIDHPCESEAFRMKKNIQLVIHPEWWIFSGTTKSQKIRRIFAANQAYIQDATADFLPGLLAPSPQR
jgi:hypothetical protein